MKVVFSSNGETQLKTSSVRIRRKVLQKLQLFSADNYFLDIDLEKDENSVGIVFLDVILYGASLAVNLAN